METNQIQNATSIQVLTKESTNSEIKTYFQKVLELKQSSNEFPVNLDEVWPLVYSAKSDAVKKLKSDFIENEDFITVGQNPHGGRFAKTDYYISVSCLEYFIARKVRSIFDVYRQVFHKVVEEAQKPLSPAEQLLQNAKLMVEYEQRIKGVESKLHVLEAKQQTRPDYFTIVGYGTLHHVSVNLKQASILGRHATKLCKDRGFETDKIPDPRFGEVKMYPVSVLDEVFEQSLTI